MRQIALIVLGVACLCLGAIVFYGAGYETEKDGKSANYCATFGAIFQIAGAVLLFLAGTL